MADLRFAPSLALPHIEVNVPDTHYGDGTQYPFGRFDFGDRLECRRFFTIFEAFSARTIKWRFTSNLHYFSIEDGPVVFAGGGNGKPQGIRRGIHFEAPNTVRPDLNSSGQTPNGLILADEGLDGTLTQWWTNPHGVELDPAQAYGTIYDANFEDLRADFNTAIILDTTPDETVFTMPDFILAGPVDAVDETSADFSLLYSALYNNNAAVADDSDPAHYRHFYSHSYRTRNHGYPSLLFIGVMVKAVPPFSGLRCEVSTHQNSLPNATNYLGTGTLFGQVGTFTLRLPDPLAANVILIYTAPLYGWAPAGKTGVTLTCDIEMAPANTLSYGDTYATDGTAIRNPLI